jgi:hypothetical protein
MDAIMSDDPKAIEKLREKLKGLEGTRDFMKSINKDFKQADGDVTKMKIIPEHQRESMVALVKKSYSWEKQPYPKWKITNIGASIRTVKKRIEQLTPKAEKIVVKKKVDYVGEVIKKHGAFFCFSTEQFNEQCAEGVKYVALDGGLCVPVKVQDELVADIGKAAVQAALDDKQTSTNKEIIWRELANHEAQYSGCIDSTVDALQGYEITREDVQAEMPDFVREAEC